MKVRAIRGLVPLGAAGELAAAAGDADPAVRTAVATGLVDDPDPNVRAAAVKAAGAIGCPGSLVGHLAAEQPWQVREGAATGACGRPQAAQRPDRRGATAR